MSLAMEMPHISESPDGCFTEYKEGSPAHYVLTIKSYSLLSETMNKYMSNDFDAGGYKWKLILYPKGNTCDNVEDHISLYISITESNNLSLGWEINAVFRFYLFDQITNKYFTMQGRITRLCAMKPVWGIAKFISLREMSEPLSGYVVDDTCVLGIDVFVAKNAIQGESLMLEKYQSCKHEWKISNFSSFPELITSEAFISGGHKWKIELYPKSYGKRKGQFVSMFLSWDDSDISWNKKIFVEYSFRIKSPDSVKAFKSEINKSWFTYASTAWGQPSFLPLSSVKEYVLNNCCTIEAEVRVLSKVQKMT